MCGDTGLIVREKRGWTGLSGRVLVLQELYSVTTSSLSDIGLRLQYNIVHIQNSADIILNQSSEDSTRERVKS